MSKSSSVSGRGKHDVNQEELFPKEYLCDRSVESSRARVPRKTFRYEGYRDEEIHRLSKSRSGSVGVLTRLNNEIRDLIINEKGNVGDILSRYDSYREAWHNFIDAHEKYLELLQGETDKQEAAASYEEQKERKIELDNMVTQWRAKVDSAQSSECKSEHESKESRSKSKVSSVSTTVVIPPI